MCVCVWCVCVCVCKLKSAFWCVVTHHVRNVHFNLWRNFSCSWNISYFWIISLQIPFLCVCVNWNLLFGALSPTMCVTCILIFDVTLAVVETFPISGSSHYRYLSCVCRVNWNLLFGALSPTMCVTCILIFDVTLAVVWNISYFWIISLQIPFLCVCVNWNLLFGALSPTMCVTCILIFDVTLAVVETFPMSGSSHYRYLSCVCV